MKFRHKKVEGPGFYAIATTLTDQFGNEIRNILRTTPIQVEHTVTRKPAPRPTAAVFVLRDPDGREYRTTSVYLGNKYSAPVYFPLAAATGRLEDAGRQILITIHLEYDPRER